MNRIKKLFAFLLAFMLAFSCVAIYSSAQEDFNAETLAFKTEIYKENDLGELVLADKVNPGDNVKARISIGTSYYTDSVTMMVFCSKDFFNTESYIANTSKTLTINPNLISSGKTTASNATITKILPDDFVLADKNLGLVSKGYLTDEYVNAHTAFVINFSFSKQKIYKLDINDWMFEFDLKISDDAENFGVFEVVESTVLSRDRIYAYIDIPVGLDENEEFGSLIPLYATNVTLSIESHTVSLNGDDTTDEPSSKPVEDEPSSKPVEDEPSTEEPTATTPDETQPAEVPSTTKPVVLPTTTRPVIDPTTTKPSATEPEVSQPAEEPSVTLPGSDEPSTEEPTATTPAETQPAEVPSTTKPAVLPITTRPVIDPTTKPSATEPEVSQPAEEPSVTLPDSDEPSDEEPSATVPDIQEPSVEAPSETEPSTQKPTSASPSTTKPAEDEPSSKPSVTDPEEEPSTTTGLKGFKINAPSRYTINCADSIRLHVSAETSLEGYTVFWSTDNNHFSASPSTTDNTCVIKSESKGETVVTATVFDEKGNEVASDSVKMTSNAGFFQKIIAFFKELFGLTKLYEK